MASADVTEAGSGRIPTAQCRFDIVRATEPSPYVQKIAASIHPTELTAVIRSRDLNPFIDQSELNADQVAKVATSLLNPEFGFRLGSKSWTSSATTP